MHDVDSNISLFIVWILSIPKKETKEKQNGKNLKTKGNAIKWHSIETYLICWHGIYTVGSNKERQRNAETKTKKEKKIHDKCNRKKAQRKQ